MSHISNKKKFFIRRSQCPSSIRTSITRQKSARENIVDVFLACVLGVRLNAISRVKHQFNINTLIDGVGESSGVRLNFQSLRRREKGTIIRGIKSDGGGITSRIFMSLLWKLTRETPGLSLSSFLSLSPLTRTLCTMISRSPLVCVHTYAYTSNEIAEVHV